MHRLCRSSIEPGFSRPWLAEAAGVGVASPPAAANGAGSGAGSSPARLGRAGGVVCDDEAARTFPIVERCVCVCFVGRRRREMRVLLGDQRGRNF